MQNFLFTAQTIIISHQQIGIMIYNTAVLVFLQGIYQGVHAILLSKICKYLNPGFLQDGSTAGELRTFPASFPSVFYAAVKWFAGFSARAAAAAAARTKNIFAAHTAGKPAVCNALFSFHEYTSPVYLKLIFTMCNFYESSLV
ncbi:hypothetical protein [Enterocloster bolteae]|uniref:hypothetical protein n=1 Tax=Enterocloster bolteae TaxID=208479 RepID=UPI002ED584E2